MEQNVRVKQLLPGGQALVVHVRQSACSGDCHKCTGCGAAEETLEFPAENPIGARPGELVTVRTDDAPVLGAAAVTYVLPLALFFLGYFGFWLLKLPGGAGGCLGFSLGVAVAVLYGRKKKKTTYTITGIVASQLPKKGDNNLD